jgi:hypothetical protein
LILCYLIPKNSAIGPNVNAGKKLNAATINMTANTIIPNVPVSVFSVPELSGIYFLFARMPAIATGPMMGKYLASSITKPQVIFQKGVLSPNPSNPLPLLADDEVNSYNISLKP